MGFLKSLAELFKGGGNAERTEECVSGGDGRECRIIHSFSSIRERAVSDIGGIRVLAAACADERSRDTGQMPSDPVRRESRALIAAAKSAGCFVEADSIPGTRYTIIGFKQSLLNLLTAALEDESNVNELIFAIHGVAKPEQKGIVSQ